MKKGAYNTTSTTIFLLVVVIVLLAAALFVSISRNTASQQNQTKVHEKTGTNTNSEKSSKPVLEKERVVIKVTANGFEPQYVTVKAANAVIAFENTDTRVHVIKADPTEQEEFNTGDLAPGQTVDVVSYTEPGTYTYSDVSNSRAKGVIIVEE